ncbi:hypothetical protein BS78_06G207600 [Paspalum vaginatum]|nr:hypothetical protein BS78_06G207600 [Paspalum vaginatum]
MICKFRLRQVPAVASTMRLGSGKVFGRAQPSSPLAGRCLLVRAHARHLWRPSARARMGQRAASLDVRHRAARHMCIQILLEDGPSPLIELYKLATPAELSVQAWLEARGAHHRLDGMPDPTQCAASAS